ncbi:SDR family NAD(P)-dependent oxidoreductase [Herbaspirillum sp. RTI4]|uniref:SDR family NAD(P)-dependent oxidoreductase n=1 Tax=Herbaspirillum sp. RTI4 TaxID=3048640 RepID=UPI002AB4CBD7|nr:SDR family NAD(P)-dependent oxidoreductase [Herbaspirillum sp. RTI4]MDY7579483.1 SDR family NAD(P)-dependent oxidoreductase [Herbaspirillum sp. RTI4]MEA9980397.1 SDR family NAD(P)-dependent oxidoreductase [Herbaspirillum sp. RTI4]
MMNPPLPAWPDCRVWVIGASTGIGAETARLLLAMGARVALSARSQDKLERVAAGHTNSLTAALDVRDPASIASARDLILQQWQGIDLVLMVAGTYTEMRADSFDLAVAENLIDINVNGVFRCLDALLPTLLQQGHGAIGIVASIAGYRGLPKAMAYGPSKAALINLSESLYLDLRPRGIGVYQITPGFVDTPLTAGNDFPMPALMTAPEAAAEMLRQLQGRQFLIHFPKKLTLWFRLLRLLPYRLYFALIHKATGL